MIIRFFEELDDRKTSITADDDDEFFENIKGLTKGNNNFEILNFMKVKETLFDYWNAQLYIDSDLSDAKLLSELQKAFPHQDFMNAQTFINQNIGGIQDALDQMLIPMTAMLCAVIMLITFLMEKLFIAREKGEIAMMKSIGIPYKTIRLWQLTRMVFVALCSMLIAIPLSYISNQFIFKADLCCDGC